VRSSIQFLRDGKFLLSFGFLAVFMGNFGQSFFIGGYGASIQESLNLSASAYGLNYSIATLLSGTSLIFVGGYIDKVPLLRFTGLVALGLWVSSLMFVFVDSAWLLLAAFFLVRLCGQGLLPHTGITTMARCFENHRGKAISVAASGVPLGEIVLPLVAAFLIAQVGWQKSWLLLTLLVPLFFLPGSYFLLKRARDKGFNFAPPVSLPEHGDAKGRIQVLRDRHFWFALPATLAAPFLVTGVFIHQSFFLQEKSWSLELFAASFVGYGAVHWLSSILAGLLVDRYTAVRVLPFYNLPMVVAMFAVSFLDGSYVAFLMLACLGMSIGFSGPVTGALWAEVYGTGKLGSIRSMTSSFGVWSTSLSPLLFGVLIDHGIGISELCLSMLLLVSVTIALTLLSYRSVRA